MFRDAVARRLGCAVLPASPLPIDVDAYRGQAWRRFTLPDLPADSASAAMRHVARGAGARAGLSGAGPDTLFTGSVLHYADLIRRGALVDLARRVMIDRQVENTGWSRSALLTAACGRCCRRRSGGGCAIRRVACRELRTSANGSGSRRRRETWSPISARRAARHVGDHLQPARWMDAGRSSPSAFGVRGRVRGSLSVAALRHYVRPFAAGGPAPPRGDHEVRVPGRRPRVGARSRIAPDQGGFLGDLIAQSLAALGGVDFFKSLAIAGAGWVEPGELAKRYDPTTRTQPDDARTSRDLPILWMIAATELWFRSCYGTGPKGALSA